MSPSLDSASHVDVTDQTSLLSSLSLSLGDQVFWDPPWALWKTPHLIWDQKDSMEFCLRGWRYGSAGKNTCLKPWGPEFESCPALKEQVGSDAADIWSSLWPLQCVYTRVCVHTHKHTNTNIHTWFFLNFFETRSVFAFSTLNYIHYFSEGRFPSATSAMFINRLQCCLFLCNKKLQVYQLKFLFSTISYLEVT